MLIIGDQIKKEDLPLIRITEDEIRGIFKTPIEIAKFERLGLVLHFYLLKNQNFYFLAMTRVIKKQNSESLNSILKLTPKFVKDSQTTNPLTLLELFVDKFGVEIKIGNRQSKLIIREAIPILGSINTTQIVQILAPRTKKSKFSQQMHIMPKKSGQTTIIQAAMAYCIDVTKYAHWLQKQ